MSFSQEAATTAKSPFVIFWAFVFLGHVAWLAVLSVSLAFGVGTIEALAYIVLGLPAYVMIGVIAAAAVLVASCPADAESAKGNPSDDRLLRLIVVAWPGFLPLVVVVLLVTALARARDYAASRSPTRRQVAYFLFNIDYEAAHDPLE